MKKGLQIFGVVLLLAATVVVTVLISNYVHQLSMSSGTPTIQNTVSIANNIRQLINTDKIRSNLHSLTKKAHVAGTENNLRVAEIIRDQMISQGLENVHFNEYNVLLSYPDWTTPNIVEILEENGDVFYKTTGRSISIIEEEQNDLVSEIQWLAYSADGTVEGDIVYVNKGTPKDIEHIESLGIDLKDKIVLARYSSNFRGNIAQMAVKKGAKACLLYSDPMQVASLGTGPSEFFKIIQANFNPFFVIDSTYGRTDKMPSHAVQRVVGWKKDPNYSLLPIPYSAAQILFEKMKGDAVIADFQGKLDVTYRYGPGLINNQKLRVTVHAKNEERKIQNVLGYIKGSQEPDKFVLVGNHYDAWTYGAVDPNSVTSTLLEVTRALKAYQNLTGWRPVTFTLVLKMGFLTRSILFAHWDAEEYGLIGSTEFAEEHRTQLMRRAVAYINTDMIGGNQSLLAMANPTVVNVLRAAAAKISHPNPKTFLPHKTIIPHIHFTSFQQVAVIICLSLIIWVFRWFSLSHHHWTARLFIPSYHTIYETPYLIDNILDPEYKMHKAMGEMLIECILNFSESRILPYDLKELMDRVLDEYFPRIQQHINKAQTFENISEYLTEPQKQFELFEKCFINPHGILGDPQSRHVLFRPSADNWYRGNAISQVHSLISKMETSVDDEELLKYSKQLSKEIAFVNVAFICAKHSLNEFFTL
eukprot:NP_001024446.1 Glutamate CarboxyPeptidase 2 homolog [Caenorhabditis elegans]